MSCVKIQHMYCVVAKIDKVVAGGFPVLNNLDCPIVMTTKRYEVIPSVHILGPISLVHQHESSCNVISNDFHTNIERECVNTPRVKGIKHDSLNILYYINVYCIDHHSVTSNL